MCKGQPRDSGAPESARRRAREEERDKFGQNPSASPREGGSRRGGNRGGGAGPRGNRLTLRSPPRPRAQQPPRPELRPAPPHTTDRPPSVLLPGRKNASSPVNSFGLFGDIILE